MAHRASVGSRVNRAIQVLVPHQVPVATVVSRVSPVTRDSVRFQVTRGSRAQAVSQVIAVRVVVVREQ